ncbi:MAG: SPOR domain-containing protein [Thermodesulfobacteriota bacterium]
MAVNTRVKKKKKGNTPVKNDRIRLFPPNRLAEIAFYSVVMFVLGVFTGRGTAPVNFEFNKENDIKHEITRKEITDPVKVRVDFHRELLSGVDTQLGSGLITNEKELPEKVPLYKDEKKHAELSSKIIKKEDNDEAEEKKEKQADEKALFSYTVQVAALKDREDAKILAEKIQKKGFPAYSVSGEADDGTKWYRVRVGKVKDRSIAEAIRKKLLEKLNINGLVLNVN